jgi:hypothetical protein
VIDAGRLGKDVAGIKDGPRSINVDDVRELSKWDISKVDEW